MPRYLYQCSECSQDFIIKHSYKERKSLCPECGKESLVRQITTPAVIKYSGKNSLKQRGTKNLKPGGITTEAIETAREEIKQQKENLKNRKK